MFTILGALLSLFIGLVPVMIGLIGDFLKVVSSRRNEARKSPWASRVVRIGRGDGCDLKFMTDSEIAPVQLGGRREKAGYVLHARSGASVRVNGQPIISHVL